MQNVLTSEIAKAIGAHDVVVIDEGNKLRVMAKWTDGTERKVEVSFSPSSFDEAVRIATNKLRPSKSAKEVHAAASVSVDGDARVQRKQARAAKKR